MHTRMSIRPLVFGRPIPQSRNPTITQTSRSIAREHSIDDGPAANVGVVDINDAAAGDVDPTTLTAALSTAALEYRGIAVVAAALTTTEMTTGMIRNWWILLMAS
jgi:hypothetical protein